MEDSREARRDNGSIRRIERSLMSMLTNFNLYLEEKVKERTLALENALSELDHFFYRASHDFRRAIDYANGFGVGISKRAIIFLKRLPLFSIR